MKEIPLTKGYVALVDDEDFELVTVIKWSACVTKKAVYAGHHYGPALDCKTVLMHRLILNAKPGEVVDHKNRNGLDNRRSNIRLASQSQNMGNAIGRNHTSSFKGVSWHNERNMWIAQANFNKTHYFLGRFHLEIDAAKAYDEKAVELFGEFARINFP